jgi:hypothetical protein
MACHERTNQQPVQIRVIGKLYLGPLLPPQRVRCALSAAESYFGKRDMGENNLLTSQLSST